MGVESHRVDMAVFPIWRRPTDAIFLSKICFYRRAWRLVAGRSLGVFCLRRGGPTGSECDRVGVRGGGARSASVSSADDDEDFGLWVLCGGVFLAQAAEGTDRGCWLSGVGSREPTRFPDDLGFSEAAAAGAARAI